MIHSLYPILISILISPKALATGAAEAANGASNSQSGAQMASQLMSAALMPTCAMQPMPPTCPMAILALAQGLSLGGTSKGAANAATALSSGGGGLGSTSSVAADPTAGGALDGSGAGLDSSAVRSNLATLGYSLSPDGSQLTTPNGATMDTGAFGTSSGMASAGFSEGAIKNAQDLLAKAQAQVAAKMKMASLDGDSGGGGGGGFSGADRGGGTNVVMMPSMPKPKPGAMAISGMTKNFGGERIGVAGDNIFEMITRRYQSQDKADGFFRN